ncbi:hypothetical protein ACFIOY_21920 [Bradyrhizobium sp. TZ2]
MGAVRFVPHMQQRRGNARIGLRAAPHPQQFAEGYAAILRRDAVFRQSRHDPDHGGLFPQIERDARPSLRHPPDQRLEVASQRIDIEEAHPSPFDAQVMQAVGQDQHAAGGAIIRRAIGGIVSDFQRRIETHGQDGGRIPVRRQPEGRPQIQHPGAPPDQFRCRHCAHSQFLESPDGFA